MDVSVVVMVAFMAFLLSRVSSDGCRVVWVGGVAVSAANSPDTRHPSPALDCFDPGRAAEGAEVEFGVVAVDGLGQTAVLAELAQGAVGRDGPAGHLAGAGQDHVEVAAVLADAGVERRRALRVLR